MQFLYHDSAGNNDITLNGDKYKYIFKVRRHNVSNDLALRNLRDEFIYFYNVEEIDKKEAKLVLKSKEKLVLKSEKNLHIGWCVIEPKVVEKTIVMLNEIGVKKISFVYCERSQRNFKIDLEKLKRIVINSSQQCGRSEMMEFEVIKSIEEFLKAYPKSVILDFGGKSLNNTQRQNFELILVGCEGGFSENEQKLFENRTIYKLDTPLVLKSESAVVSMSSKCLL